MFFVYRGAGIAVVLVTLGMMGIFDLLFPKAHKNEQWPLGCSFMVAGAVLLPLGLWLNRARKAMVPVTSELLEVLFPGQSVHCEMMGPGGQHVLYGVRIEIWAVVLLLGGLVLVVV